MDAIDRINALLAAKGKTGAEMSRELGLSNSIYSQWNTRKAKPSNKTLTKIAAYFGITVQQLLGWDDPSNPIEFEVPMQELSEMVHSEATKKAPADSSRGSCVVSRSNDVAPIDDVDDDLRDYLDELRNRPDKKLLFSVTKGATKEEIMAIVRMYEELKREK